MEVGIAVERPPFVRFVKKPVEDRNATIQAGYPKYRDVNWALITPSGSKDTVERVAEEWLDHLDQQAREGRFNREWARMFRDFYKEWLVTGEVPLNGTSIKLWPGATPAQVENLLAIKILTVEDLAAANEDGLRRIGMGGRELRDKAIAWLKSAADHGSVAAENAALKQEVESLRGAVKALGGKLEQVRMLVPEASRPPIEVTEVAGGLLTTGAREVGVDQALAKGL